MAYGIHGDEISSTDAAAALLYRLAAGDDEWARSIRKGAVVLIDPCENPDGRERALAQARWLAHAKPTGDLEDLSHTAIWPYGRGNHYMTDMNRDWITLVQPESARVDTIATWNPQLMVDSHEMGSDDTYLFSPARAPFNPFLSKAYLFWARRYAQDQAHALDTRGYPYYTREWNEEFFPGYGSSWAMYRGAIGILYEMSGTDGTLVRKPSGEVRTYGQAVEHHVISSVANLTTLVEHRQDALAATLAARREGIERGAQAKVRAWVFSSARFPDRVRDLAHLLERQGIETLRLSSPASIPALTSIATGTSASVDLPAGSVLVPLDQPSNALARAILDPHIPMETSFLKDERKSLETGKGTRIYDTTAWSLPLMYGIEAYWSGSRPAGDWKRDASAEPPRGGLAPATGNTTFGWVFDGTSDAAAYAVADLLDAGVSARLAEKPFVVGGKSFGPGAVLVIREANGPDVKRVLDDIGRKRGVSIGTAATALADDGADLGGRYFHPLAAPRIGVLAGQAISRDGYGAIWHYLDRVVDQRFTALDATRFDGIDLRRFNVIVVPPTAWPADAVEAILGKSGLEALKRWVEAGGTLVGIGSGAEFVADKDAGLTRARLRSQALDTSLSPVWSVGADEAMTAGPLPATGLAPSDLRSEVKPASARASSPRPPASQTEKSKRESPYDVAPVIGPGAKAFVEGVDLGTPLSSGPMPMDAWLKTLLPEGQSPKDEDRRRADERLRRFAPQGALLRADLDGDLYLTWGMPPDLTVWIGIDDALVSSPPVRAAAIFSGVDTIHRGGLLWPEAAARLAKTAYATREASGRGQVILFLDNPVYREWMVGTRRLFLNALLYGPGVGAEPPAPW